MAGVAETVAEGPPAGLGAAMTVQVRDGLSEPDTAMTVDVTRRRPFVR